MANGRDGHRVKNRVRLFQISFGHGLPRTQDETQTDCFNYHPVRGCKWCITAGAAFESYK